MDQQQPYVMLHPKTFRKTRGYFWTGLRICCVQTLMVFPPSLHAHGNRRPTPCIKPDSPSSMRFLSSVLELAWQNLKMVWWSISSWVKEGPFTRDRSADWITYSRLSLVVNSSMLSEMLALCSSGRARLAMQKRCTVPSVKEKESNVCFQGNDIVVSSIYI